MRMRERASARVREKVRVGMKRLGLWLELEGAFWLGLEIGLRVKVGVS
jgi:hypothetical protein